MRLWILLAALVVTLAGCATDTPLETGCVRLAEFQFPKPFGTVSASERGQPIVEQPMIAFDQVPTPPTIAAVPGATAVQPIWSDALILSGGGQWGAYGAGVIDGWRDHGRHPARVVTGISTGALQATFAYLEGRHYDDLLVKAYSIDDERQLVIRHGSLFFLRHGSTADIAPAKDYIRARVGPLLDAVKTEYDITHRQLFVGAVDGLSGRFHTFDLTRMASELSGAERLDCYSAALLASASVPVVFRQTTINHRPWLDGGLRRALFLPEMVQQIGNAKAAAKAHGTLVPTDGRVYAIKNGITEPQSVETLPAKLLPTVNRLRSIVFNQLEQDSIDIAGVYAHRAGLRYFTTSADGWRNYPPCKDAVAGEEDRIFDPAFMRCMIAFGRSRWEDGRSPWTEQIAP